MITRRNSARPLPRPTQIPHWTRSVDCGTCLDDGVYTGLVDGDLLGIGIEQPGEFRAILNPAHHLPLGLRQAVSFRQQLDDKVRTEAREARELIVRSE